MFELQACATKPRTGFSTPKPVFFSKVPFSHCALLIFLSPKAWLTHILSLQLCKMHSLSKWTGDHVCKSWEATGIHSKYITRLFTHRGIYVTNGDREMGLATTLVFRPHLFSFFHLFCFWFCFFWGRLAHCRGLNIYCAPRLVSNLWQSSGLRLSTAEVIGVNPHTLVGLSFKTNLLSLP